MPTYESEDATKADEDAIRAWFDRYVANNNAGDFDVYGDFWTEDATWLPPDAPVVEGREAILEYARPFFEGYTIDQQFAVEEIEVADGFAFARVNSTERYTPKADEGEPLDLSVKAIFILRRQPDGSWVSSHCVWNNNAPASQAKEELARFKNDESLKAANIELAKQYYRYLDAVNLDSLRAMTTSDAKIFYGSAEPITYPDIEPLVKMFYTSFPDYKHEIQNIFAAEDKVVAQISYSATFTKEFMDIKPNGAEFAYKGIQIFQFADNKVSNFWAIEDELGMMTQLGMELKPKE